MRTRDRRLIRQGMTTALDDEIYMDMALEEAGAAQADGEVPVGAVLVRRGEILSRAHNRPIAFCDPCAHAEILAIRAAAHNLGNYRLNGATLYVTLEPCAMCCGAIIQARIARLVFGARDAKGGAVVSLYQLLADSRLNHQVAVTEGIRREICAEIIGGFFRQKRLGSPAF